jgi:t-SNARE complex subunit (syntaxin)
MRDRLDELNVTHGKRISNIQTYDDPPVSMGEFLDELAYIDGSLEQMVDAVEAVEVLQEKILNSATSAEEAALVRQYEEVSFECNQMANMVKNKLKGMLNLLYRLLFSS